MADSVSKIILCGMLTDDDEWFRVFYGDGRTFVLLSV